MKPPSAPFPRPVSRTLRRWALACLLATLPFYGMGALSALVAGPLHVHLDGGAHRADRDSDIGGFAHAAGHLVRPIRSVVGSAMDAHGLHAHGSHVHGSHVHGSDVHGSDVHGSDVHGSHGHDHAERAAAPDRPEGEHATPRRHRHDPADATVVALDDGHADEDVPTPSWAWQVVGVARGASPPLPPTRRAARPPDRSADFSSHHPPLPERPPRA